MLGFDYEIHYKTGLFNKVVDALSRKLEQLDVQLLAISSPVPNMIKLLRQFYSQHSMGQALLAQWDSDTEFRVKFKLSDGLLYFSERIFILPESDLQQLVLTELHSMPIGAIPDTELL